MKDDKFKKEVLVEMSKNEKRRNAISEFIILPTKRELTEEEKNVYLHLNPDVIPNDMLYRLWIILKDYVKNGKIDDKDIEKYMKVKEKKIMMPGIPEEWQKNPKRKGEDKDER